MTSEFSSNTLVNVTDDIIKSFKTCHIVKIHVTNFFIYKKPKIYFLILYKSVLIGKRNKLNRFFKRWEFTLNLW